ncbi:hypothetical protein Hc94105_1132 [Helicobacter cinaedi]|uniref:conjugal transfer protein TraF n=1 Tax=Helicobacter cinaedi TaxID=213 RepID=UPI001F329157|nr:conjugal transfer protein TraF [Helicobacter cinaedi]BDB66930.1 hypothetical protein Hc94105_1132 [Helicobacter cinaedi]
MRPKHKKMGHKTMRHKVMALAMCAGVSSFGLEFGSMGQVSAGMGGAGVAVRDSAWGLYYNPALLGSDRRTKMGYSFGIQFKEQNLLQLATIDVANLEKLPDTLTNQLTGPSSGGTSVEIGGQKVDGALGGMVNALFPDAKDGKVTEGDVEKLVQKVTGNDKLTCKDITSCWGEIKGDALNDLKDKLAGAATEGGSPLVGQIINGVDPSELPEIMEEVSSGKFDANTMLEKVGKLTIAKGADSVIDKLLNDFGVVDGALKGNDVNLATQNGFVFQFAGDKGSRRVESDTLGTINIQEIDSGRGAVGIGLFASAFSNASAQIDPNNNKLIFDLGGKYYQASISGNSVTLEYLQNQGQGLTGSIMNDKAQHSLYANALALVEIPIGYGHTIFTPMGDVNLGLAVKFIQGIGYGDKVNFAVGNMPSVSVDKNKMDMAQTFGLDFGMLYSPRFVKNLHLGLVAKNVNSPTINRTGVADTTLHPQVRAGVSYEMMDFLTFAFDADVLPNETLSLSSPKSQFFGGGVMANFKKVDFRLGAMQDIRSNAGEGLILTGGLNLFGFLDVAMQYGLGQNITIQGINVSNYMSLRVGGQFSF